MNTEVPLASVLHSALRLSAGPMEEAVSSARAGEDHGVLPPQKRGAKRNLEDGEVGRWAHVGNVPPFRAVASLK
jgi:hypothetical protein